MKRSKPSQPWYIGSVLFAGFLLPLEKSENWLELSYNKIPSNQVTFSKTQIEIAVKNSAGPLVYKFDELKIIKQFSLDIEIDGKMKTSPKESSSFEEDSYLRIGFVVPGQKTLSWYQKKFAADWILKLFELGQKVKSSKYSGVDRIDFYNISSLMTIGQKRQHPKSDLLYEQIILAWDTTIANKENGDENKTPHGKNESAIPSGAKNKKIVEYTLPSQTETLGIWLSADGDNTQSDFRLKIRKIEFQ